MSFKGGEALKQKTVVEADGDVLAVGVVDGVVLRESSQVVEELRAESAAEISKSFKIFLESQSRAHQ